MQNLVPYLTYLSRYPERHWIQRTPGVINHLTAHQSQCQPDWNVYVIKGSFYNHVKPP